MTTLFAQSFRFLLTGILNTAVGYGIYLIGLWVGLLPEVALGLATILGATFNYFTTSRLVFEYSRVDRLPRFMAAYAFIYVINAACLRGVIELGVRPSLAQLGMLPVMAVISFGAFRYFVFPRTPGS